MPTPLQPHSIFICYRRGDSLDLVGRIYDHLAHTFGENAVFRDMESIASGRDFAQTIDEALAAAKVGVVIIGPKWMELLHSHRADHQDYVGLECEEMLRKANFRTITCCLNDARMPAPNDLPASLQKLTYIQACNVRSDRSFKADVNHLIEVIEATLADIDRQAAASLPARPPVSTTPPPAPPAAVRPKSGVLIPIIATVGALFVLSVVGFIALAFLGSSSKDIASKSQSKATPKVESAPAINPPSSAQTESETDVPSVGSVISANASDRASSEDTKSKEPPSLSLWKHDRPTTHKVQDGDTVASISRKYGVSASEIRRLNSLEEDSDLEPGTQLEIPPKKAE